MVSVSIIYGLSFTTCFPLRNHLESVLSLPQTATRVKDLNEQYKGKVVILGVDDMDLFKGISLKFLALGQLLDEHEGLRGKVVLVQILNAARSRGKDIQDVKNESEAIAKEINEKYGKNGYQPIVCINGPVSTQEKAAYYAISECCVVSAVRDGMNLMPYEYTVCRQGSVELDKALGGVEGEALKPKLFFCCINSSPPFLLYKLFFCSVLKVEDDF